MLLGVSENPDKIPEHEGRRWANVQVKAASNEREDKEPSKDCSNLKSCESPYTFIGRRRDFYIPTIPLNSKNIPSVNTHKCLLQLIHLQACH
jgi:hypothetical protein